MFTLLCVLAIFVMLGSLMVVGVSINDFARQMEEFSGFLEKRYTMTREENTETKNNLSDADKAKKAATDALLERSKEVATKSAGNPPMAAR